LKEEKQFFLYEREKKRERGSNHITYYSERGEKELEKEKYISSFRRGGRKETQARWGKEGLYVIAISG